MSVHRAASRFVSLRRFVAIVVEVSLRECACPTMLTTQDSKNHTGELLRLAAVTSLLARPRQGALPPGRTRADWSDPGIVERDVPVQAHPGAARPAPHATEPYRYRPPRVSPRTLRQKGAYTDWIPPLEGKYGRSCARLGPKSATSCGSRFFGVSTAGGQENWTPALAISLGTPPRNPVGTVFLFACRRVLAAARWARAK